MLSEFENLIHKLNKNHSNDNDKKSIKSNKSILLDTATIDNDSLQNQIKKQMSKSERMLRSE